MTRIITPLALAITFAAGSALAQMTIEDSDGDGMYSMAEMAAAMPEMTEDQFNEIDTSGDGLVDADELAAAQEAGLIAG